MNLLRILALVAALVLAVPSLATGTRNADDGAGTGSGDRARADTAEECHPYPLVNGECRFPEGPDGGDADGGDAGDAGPGPGDSGDDGGDDGDGDGDGDGDNGEGPY